MRRYMMAIMGLFGISLGLLVFTQYGQAKKTEAAHTTLTVAERQQYPSVLVGMGCFWGAQKRMSALHGIVDTEVGYAGGADPRPNYQSILAKEYSTNDGQVNHAEVVKVWYDPKVVPLEGVLAQFWENHDPTQGNRQGNDIGTNYRSAIYVATPAELKTAEASKAYYQADLAKAGHLDPMTTEITYVKNYTSAESYHQDYLVKNPLGYCGHGGLDIAYSHQKLAQKTNAAPVAVDVSGINSSWKGVQLSSAVQLIAFEASDCGYCKQFHQDFKTWRATIPLHNTYAKTTPADWQLKQTVFATPTFVLFKNKQEVARYTGYRGEAALRDWLKSQHITVKQ